MEMCILRKKTKRTMYRVLAICVIVVGAYFLINAFLAGAPPEETTASTRITVNTVDRNGKLVGATLDIDCYNISGKTDAQIAALVFTDFSAAFNVDTNTTSGFVFTPEADYLYICNATGTGLQTNYAQLALGTNNIAMWIVPDSVNILAYSSTGNTSVTNLTEHDWTVDIFCVKSGILNDTVGYHALCDLTKGSRSEWGVSNSYPYLNVTFASAPEVSDITCAFSLGNVLVGNSIIVPLGSISGHNMVTLSFGSKIHTVLPTNISLWTGKTTTSSMLDSQA
jgi:hypothetical protein